LESEETKAIDIVPLYKSSRMELVNDIVSFEKMMGSLEEETEITLDLEGNDEHSYLGNKILHD